MAGREPDLINPRLAKAVEHPTRIEILAEDEAPTPMTVAIMQFPMPEEGE